MNSFIIRTLYKRSKSNLTESVIRRNEGHNQGQSEGHTNPMKTAEQQIYTMLLLVTFGYLILTTPGYAMLFYVNYVDYLQSPFHYAAYVLFFQVGEKTYYTNFGINFFLYVLSGQKFRKDLINLFVQRKSKGGNSAEATSDINTVSSLCSQP